MADYLETRELYHSGIKGQRWGIRRYQNEDGTLTEAGKLRYRTKKDDAYGISDKDVAERTRSKELETESKISGEASNAIYNVANHLNSSTVAIKKNYDKLSDEELRKRINRLRLEEDYGKLSGDTKYKKTGEAWVKDTLTIAGTVLALGTAATTIASNIALLKSGMIGTSQDKVK